MPDRNPFEETMRAGQSGLDGLNVPRRAMTRTGHQRDAREQWQQDARRHYDANTRYEQFQMLANEPGAQAKEREVARDFGGNIRSFTPHLQQGINTRTDPARATELGWAGNWPGTPLGYSMDPRWNYTTTPGDPFDYTTSTRGMEDEGLGLGLEEAAIGGGSAAAAAGMGTKTLDTRAEESLWKQANKTVRSQVGDRAADANNQSLVRQQWEKLKNIFYSKKYGGGPPGTSGGGGLNIGKGLKTIGRGLGKYGKLGSFLGPLTGLGYAADILSPSNIMGFKEEDAPTSFSRGGIASLIRRL